MATKLRCWPQAAILSLSVLTWLGRIAAGDAPPAAVALFSPKPRYVLGEPVLLHVVVRNLTAETLEMCDVLVNELPLCPEISVYIAAGGGQFRCFVPMPCEEADREYAAVAIKPHGMVHYVCRVLYADEPRPRLAFPTPGEYRVKVRFPLTLVDRRSGKSVEPGRSWALESNVTKVNVGEPQGQDGVVWQTVQSREFLYFLQRGGPPRDALHVPARAARVLNSVPDSSYHDDLRWALAKWYYEYPEDRKAMSAEELDLVRKVLGLDRWGEFPGPTDRRLDYYYVDYKPRPGTHRLNDLLAAITRETGVPLRSEFRYGDYPMRIVRAREPVPLRVYLERMTALGLTAWFREGDGYVLRGLQPRGEGRCGGVREEKSRRVVPDP